MTVNGFMMSVETYNKMVNYCLEQKPIEACGFLSGINQITTRFWSIQNIDQSAVSFSMSQQEVESTFAQIKKINHQVYGIFHSHPTTPPYPSNFDIEHFSYPFSYMIVSLKYSRPKLRSYKITNRYVQKERIFLIQS